MPKQTKKPDRFHLHIRMPVHLLDRLKAVAERRGHTVSATIIEAVHLYLEKHENER